MSVWKSRRVSENRQVIVITHRPQMSNPHHSQSEAIEISPKEKFLPLRDVTRTRRFHWLAKNPQTPPRIYCNKGRNLIGPIFGPLRTGQRSDEIFMRYLFFKEEHFEIRMPLAHVGLHAFWKKRVELRIFVLPKKFVLKSCVSTWPFKTFRLFSIITLNDLKS